MKNEDYDENDESDSADEQIEQLLRANELLKQELASTQQHLASSSMALSASLAQQAQAGDALVSFGEGVEKRWLNARSIRALALTRGHTVQPSFALMVDELQVTEFLAPENAEQVLDEAASALNQILQPRQE